jgi:C-terminal peptidase prc
LDGLAQQADLAPPSPLPSRRSLLLAAASLAVATGLLSPKTASAVTTEQLLFLEAWRAVDRAYVDKGFNGQAWFRVRERYLKEEQMRTREETYAAVRKLLASLDDPFTRFLEPDRLSALRSGTKGSVTGVGLEIAFEQQQQKQGAGAAAEVAVVAPAAGGPAEAAGVRAGDVIAAIDGRATAGMSLYEASELLQGEEGTKVALTLRRGGGNGGNNKKTNTAAAPKTLSVDVTRRKVEIRPVEARLCADGSAKSSPVGYIRLATFNNNSAAASADAVRDLGSKGARRFVLDLRNNGGGVFAAAVAIARQWIAKGDLVLIADAQGVRDVYSADPGELVGKAGEGAPLVVLVNRGTASAAEVLAGALKDSARAKRVVGERTYGKGLIQTVVDLSDGSGVAVTVARYQTPNGTDINKIGIRPDVEVATASAALAASAVGGTGEGDASNGGSSGSGDDGADGAATTPALPPPGAEALCKFIADGGAEAWFA